MNLRGFDGGSVRLPLRNLEAAEVAKSPLSCEHWHRIAEQALCWLPDGCEPF
jgi:hypothetical protein